MTSATAITLAPVYTAHLLILPDPVVHSPAIALRMEVLPAPLGPTSSRVSSLPTCIFAMYRIALHGRERKEEIPKDSASSFARPAPSHV